MNKSKHDNFTKNDKFQEFIRGLNEKERKVVYAACTLRKHYYSEKMKLEALEVKGDELFRTKLCLKGTIEEQKEKIGDAKLNLGVTQSSYDRKYKDLKKRLARLEGQIKKYHYTHNVQAENECRHERNQLNAELRQLQKPCKEREVLDAAYAAFQETKESLIRVDSAYAVILREIAGQKEKTEEARLNYARASSKSYLAPFYYQEYFENWYNFYIGVPFDGKIFSFQKRSRDGYIWVMFYYHDRLGKALFNAEGHLVYLLDDQDVLFRRD